MHRKLHATEEHVCSECGFTCKLKKVLDRHMVVHKEEKSIQCPYCTYRCRRRMDVKKHIACMHSGKPRRKKVEESCCSLLAGMNVPFEREVVVHFLQPAPRRYARVDLFWKTAFGAIIFEVDEWAHSSGYSVQYECMRKERNQLLC